MKMPNALILIGALTILTCGVSMAQQEEDLILGFREKSKYQIVIPDAMPEEVVSNSVTQAANLLKTAFATNGIVLEIKHESEVDTTRSGLYLGPTKFAAAHGVDVSKLSGWRYIHKAVGANLIIVGNDEPDRLVGKRDNTRADVTMPYKGTWFAAAEFAYQYVGARYLPTSASGVTFVPTSIIHVPHDLNTDTSPWFLEHDMFSTPSFFTMATHCHKFQRIWSRWGHQHDSAVPMSEYGRSHPEYFIQAGDVRQPALNTENGQLCFSNPEVRELIYAHILAMCDLGYDIVELGQADGFTPCQCAECAALYGIKPTTVPSDGIAWYRDPAWGEKIWIMHRDMALRLLKDRPEKKVMLTSYGPTIPAPRSISEFPPNAIIEMMDSSAKSFANWKSIKVPAGFAAYLYNWGNFHLVGLTPLCTVPQIAEQNRLLVENNVRIVQVNGAIGSGQYGLEGPNLYVYLRMGIDPDGKTADELFNEYLQAAFREAETPMRRFFLSLQKRVELLSLIEPHVQKTGRDPLFALGTLYTPDLINALEEDLTRAEKLASLSEVKARLDIVRYEFDYLKHIAWVINAYRNFQAMNNTASLNQLLDALEARNDFVAQIANGDDKYPKNQNPAYRYMSEQGIKYAGRYMDIAPFNWDTVKMRSAPDQLLRQERSMDAKRVELAPTMDSPIWEQAAAESLSSMNLSETNLNATTQFRILYDQDNLYIRVNGDQPAERMTFAKRGRDAELWLQESIVINLSPTADKSRYYYLAYEPEPSSFNDAAHGFITDLYHPRYGWNDEGWNGQWSFNTQLVPTKNRWESMAIIPFKTLGAATPKPGDVWCINVGRIHFYDIEGKGNTRELSVWTGNLNASRVPGDGSFGMLTFK